MNEPQPQERFTETLNTPPYPGPGIPPASHTYPPLSGYTLGYLAPVVRPKANSLAVTSLVASLIGIILVPFLGWIVGIITGHIALDQIETSGEGGRGQALAGMLIGYTCLVLSIPALISLFWFFPLILESIGHHL